MKNNRSPVFLGIDCESDSAQIAPALLAALLDASPTRACDFVVDADVESRWCPSSSFASNSA
jgi:hypothetical protein